MTEERVEELAEKAVALHRSGYNCAQAVACALSGEVGVDEDSVLSPDGGLWSWNGADA